MTTIPRPEPNEYAPYASLYVDRVPDDGQVLRHLQANLQVIEDLARARAAEQLTTPHAPGEWTIQEILIHILDTERVVAYRALRIARGDTTPLPGFEQDGYVVFSDANHRPIDSILEEYRAVRAATLTLFRSLSDDAWLRMGTASNNPLSVRGAAYFIAGHELHHLASIRENYG